jgi:hypothetical protein
MITELISKRDYDGGYRGGALPLRKLVKVQA